MNAPYYPPAPQGVIPPPPQAPGVQSYPASQVAPAAPQHMPPPPSPAALGVQVGYAPVAPMAQQAPQGYVPPTPNGMVAPAGHGTQGAPQGADPRRIKLGPVRVHFFYILRRDKKNKQRCTFMLPKNDVAGVAAVNAAVEAAVVQKWGNNRPSWFQHPLHDGDLRIPNQKPPLPEYAGYYYINAAGVGSQIVRVLDQYGHEIQNPAQVKWGDWVRVSLSFYGSDKDNNIGVFCSINSIVFHSSGESLHKEGGFVMAEDEFAGDFQAPPAGYVPPAAYNPANDIPQFEYAPPTPAQVAQGFAPQPAAPVQGYAPVAAPAPGYAPAAGAMPVTPMATAPVVAPQPYVPPAPVATAPSGPPPGVPVSPDGQYWWDGTQWVHV